NLRVGWMATEAGAPAIDMNRRYGSPKIHEDMARILGWKSPERLNSDWLRILQKLDEAILGDVLVLFLEHATISPGLYTIKNTMIDDFPDGKFLLNSDGALAVDIPKSRTMPFVLTADHLSLLQHVSWTASCVDPKRPYGDMTCYYIDMANILGVPFNRDGEGRPLFSSDQIRRFDKLHGEMVFALQTFLQYAELKPCRFVRKGDEPWRMVDPKFANSGANETGGMLTPARLSGQPRMVSGEDIANQNAQVQEFRSSKKTTSESANARKQIFGSLLDLFNLGKAPSLDEAVQSSILRTSGFIDAQPNNPLLYATRASYLKQAKLYDAAIADYSKALELGESNQLAYMWYEGRALAYNTLGKETQALADFSKTIELKPQYIPAYYYRGRIYNNRKESEKALSDFNFVIESNPGWNPDVYYSRAVSNLSLGNSLESARDFKYFLDSDKWQDKTAPYAVLLGYVAFRKAGKHLDAQALIATASQKFTDSSWPSIVIQYLLGKESAEKILSAASGNDDLTEAHWFIGAKLLYDSRIEDARKHLGWVVENGNKSFLDYDLARNELAKLKN
ncbi:MAG: hypothetical protein K2X81_11975, partial [Candidatus Obscuribacterales bacterium]|nr:hypothetical protein [Candidatus Obscuribacterales bacterium]